MYRLLVTTNTLEHTRRRNRDSAAKRLSLPVRPRMAAPGQGREAARLPQLQEPAVGHAKDWQQTAGINDQGPSSGRSESEGGNECMIRSL